MALNLSEHVSAIAERWKAEAARDVASPSPVFGEQLPSVIAGLGAWIAGREREALDAFHAFAELHVVERHRARGSAVDVLREYAALRSAVIAVVLEVGSPDDILANIVPLSRGVDALISCALVRFEAEHERIRERFVSMLVHDLRDPLTAVMMSANLLGDMTLGERQSQMVGRITRGARRIERMVDEVVDFARSRVGDGITISPASFDMVEVCHEAIGEARTFPAARDIALDVSGDLKGSWDRDRVRQALLSLIANATQSGQGAIQLRATERPDHGAVFTTVVNHGPVMSSEMLARAFDPFGRALLDPSRVRGLGLGLYLADRIARAHGGRVTATSTIETGTAFTIEWPRSPRG